jgi:hypothetical protein
MSSGPGLKPGGNESRYLAIGVLLFEFFVAAEALLVNRPVTVDTAAPSAVPSETIVFKKNRREVSIFNCWACRGILLCQKRHNIPVVDMSIAHQADWPDKFF